MRIVIRCGILVLGFLTLEGGAESLRAGDRFMRLPTTLSPDGNWVLAWGPELRKGAKLSSMTEVKFGDPTFADGDSGECFFVNARMGTVAAAMPGVDYWNNGEYHQTHGSLDLAWTPDASGVLVINGGRWSTNAILWVDTNTRCVTDVQKQLDGAVNRLVLKDHGKKNAALATTYSFHMPTMVAPSVLRMKCIACNFDKSRDFEPSYNYHLTFQVKAGGANKVQLLLTKAVPMKEDEPFSNPYIEDEQLDAELNLVYGRLRKGLDGGDQEVLKKQQILWLKARETLPTSALKDEFTRLRIGDLMARTEAN